MPIKRTDLPPTPPPPPTLAVVPIPPTIADLFPRLARRAAAMLATGELVQNADGTYTRHILPEEQDQAA